jgi:hypothetical protein
VEHVGTGQYYWLVTEASSDSVCYCKLILYNANAGYTYWIECIVWVGSRLKHEGAVGCM